MLKRKLKFLELLLTDSVQDSPLQQTQAQGVPVRTNAEPKLSEIPCICVLGCEERLKEKQQNRKTEAVVSDLASSIRADPQDSPKGRHDSVRAMEGWLCAGEPQVFRLAWLVLHEKYCGLVACTGLVVLFIYLFLM
jgi:hypothetical protein